VRIASDVCAVEYEVAENIADEARTGRIIRKNKIDIDGSSAERKCRSDCAELCEIGHTRPCIVESILCIGDNCAGLALVLVLPNTTIIWNIRDLGPSH